MCDTNLSMCSKIDEELSLFCTFTIIAKLNEQISSYIIKILTNIKGVTKCFNFFSDGHIVKLLITYKCQNQTSQYQKMTEVKNMLK